MNRYFLYTIISVCFLQSLPGVATAQDIKVSAEIDSARILIGQQANLKLEVIHPESIITSWTMVPDTIGSVEVISRGKIDTSLSNGVIRLLQTIRITSFDSGYHPLPPFVFSYRTPGDTTLLSVSTEALLLEVSTVSVDTSKAIKDIKGIRRVPYEWQEALPYVLGAVIAGILLYLLIIWIRKKRRKDLPEIEVPKRPPYDVAMEELRMLDDAKLWQQGFVKEYHSRLSEIIRKFIADNWHVPAMEMTTHEIISLNVIKRQRGEILDDLSQMLELSDLVKFAKVTPIHHENEQSMRSAFRFVESNKPVSPVVTEEKEDDD